MWATFMQIKEYSKYFLSSALNICMCLKPKSLDRFMLEVPAIHLAKALKCSWKVFFYLDAQCGFQIRALTTLQKYKKPSKKCTAHKTAQFGHDRSISSRKTSKPQQIQPSRKFTSVTKSAQHAGKGKAQNFLFPRLQAIGGYWHCSSICFPQDGSVLCKMLLVLKSIHSLGMKGTFMFSLTRKRSHRGAGLDVGFGSPYKSARLSSSVSPWSS